jgi:hypothetical protein
MQSLDSNELRAKYEALREKADSLRHQANLWITSPEQEELNRRIRSETVQAVIELETFRKMIEAASQQPGGPS